VTASPTATASAAKPQSNTSLAPVPDDSPEKNSVSRISVAKSAIVAPAITS
jgi:hypothetical protein